MVRQPEVTKPAADTTPVATPPKVDYATDLFNMLSMDGPSENGSEAVSADDNSWAGFQCMYLFSLFSRRVLFFWIVLAVELGYFFLLL